MKLKTAHAKFEAAKLQLRAAVEAEYPLDCEVVSHARAHPIRGTIAGYGHEPGSVIVRNSTTQKSHTAYTMSDWCPVHKV